MAHEISKRDVQTGTEMAWHQLTTIVPEVTNDNCGILYDMELRQLMYELNGTLVNGNGWQIVSLDDGLPVGRPVGDRYKLFSNPQIWDSVQSGLAGTPHQIVSCGTVRERSLGFISIQVAADFAVGHRQIKPILNVTWGHGGNEVVQVTNSSVTIVCANTLAMALRKGGMTQQLRMRHTASADVAEIGRAVEAHIGVAAEFRAALETLEAIPATTSDARAIYAGHLAAELGLPDSTTGHTRRLNEVNALADAFAGGRGNYGATMLDVLNGWTDVHTAGVSFESSEFGTARTQKVDFMRMLIDDKSRAERLAFFATL
jgi:hypothetical protein